MDINVGQLLAHRAHSFSNVEAVVDAKQRLTYGQLNDQVNRLAHFIDDKKMKPGERISLLCQNSASMLSIFYAAAKRGVVSLPLNVRLNVEEMVYILNDGEPQILFYDESFAEVVEQLRKRVPTIHTYVQIGEKPDNDLLFEQILDQYPADEPTLHGGGEDHLLLIYTSGTTGFPKGVIISHENLWMAGYNIGNHFEWRSFDRCLIITPMFHISGHMMSITNFLRGSTIVYADFHPQGTWQVIEAERITQFMCVPAMIKLMMNEPNWMERNIDALRFIICGADTVPPQLIETCNSFGIEICHGYGCTEFAGTIGSWTGGMDKEKKHTVGRPFPFTEVKIVDPNTGEDLPPDLVGEIVCRGPQMFKGYWRQPEETAKVMRDGWYHTGDMGKMDQDGYLMIVDRLKDVIISAGSNIYPAEVEGTLLNLEGIFEVAVVGAPDETLGQIPVIFVVKRPHSQLTKDDIIDFCRGRLAAYKCTEHIVFIDQLPRNSSGKVMKDELRKVAAQIVADQ